LCLKGIVRDARYRSAQLFPPPLREGVAAERNVIGQPQKYNC
jgi:hypothetical protein